MSRSKRKLRSIQSNRPKQEAGAGRQSLETRVAYLEAKMSRRSIGEHLLYPVAVSIVGTLATYGVIQGLAPIWEDKHEIGLLVAYKDDFWTDASLSEAPQGFESLSVLLSNDGDFTEKEVAIRVEFTFPTPFTLSENVAINAYNQLLIDESDLVFTTNTPTFKVFETTLKNVQPDENTLFTFYPSERVNVYGFAKSPDARAEDTALISEATPESSG